MTSQNYGITLTFVLIGCALTVHTNTIEGRVELSTTKEMEELVRNSTLGCGIPNVSVESLYDPDLNETTLQELKCAVACVIKNIGLITENNEFSREGFTEFIKLLPDTTHSTEGNEDHDENSSWELCDVEEFEEKCTTIKGNNECDVGWDIFHCFRNVCEPKEETNSNEDKDESDT